MFDKCSIMSSNNPYDLPQVSLGFRDLEEILREKNLKIPQEIQSSFLKRYKAELEKAAQDGIIKALNDILDDGPVRQVFKIHSLMPELKDLDPFKVANESV